jgi:Trypsin-co-occurring domain 2
VVGVGGVELASVVRQLRAELNEALADAQGERLRFELGPVQVALSVTVGREGGAGAKVRFWVIEAGADAKVSRDSVQEIKLVLTPVDTQAPAGPGGKLAAPLIEGVAVAGED